MRPRGRPPTPSARSRPSEPVETVSISTARSRWPSFMTEPLPKARSICPIAASRARCRSPESRLREVASSAISPRPRCSLCCLAPYTPAAARVEALVEEPQELCLLVASVAHECGDLVPAAMRYLLYHPSAQEQTKDSSVLGGARHGSSVPGMPGHRKGESSERLCALAVDRPRGQCIAVWLPAHAGRYPHQWATSSSNRGGTPDDRQLSSR